MPVAIPAPLNPAPFNPAATAPRAPGRAQPGPAVTAGGFISAPRTLLLVEDSRLAAEAVRLICRRLGIRLRRADSLGSAALHLRVYRPDIALVDLGLPDGSGLDLIAALARGAGRPRRLVAISGEVGQAEAARQAGADAFILKPLSLAGHLSLLTGDDDLPPPEPVAAADSRNAGADPLALRDDLRMVQDLLTGPRAQARTRYAGQLLASVASALHDEGLASAARDATARGDRQALVALAHSRARALAPI